MDHKIHTVNCEGESKMFLTFDQVTTEFYDLQDLMRPNGI